MERLQRTAERLEWLSLSLPSSWDGVHRSLQEGGVLSGCGTFAAAVMAVGFGDVDSHPVHDTGYFSLWLQFFRLRRPLLPSSTECGCIANAVARESLYCILVVTLKFWWSSVARGIGILWVIILLCLYNATCQALHEFFNSVCVSEV